MNTCMRLLRLLKAAVFSDRYSHFGYEPDLGGNKFYDVEGFPAIILPEENPLYRGNTAMQNYVWSILPREIVIFLLDGDGTGGRGSLLYTHSSSGM